MSAKGVKHTKKQKTMMKQLIKQIGPKTRLAELTLANWKAEKRAGLATAVDGEAGIVRIPLEQLDDSPFQLRHDIDQDELDELTQSIRVRGLLNPILVRPAARDYEIISGHRRVAGFRRLSFAANTDAEHKKWDSIPARVLPSMTDDQVLLLGLAENMFRADISPMDAAQGLVTLENLKPELKSASLIAQATGLQEKKVQRLLRLADSPEVVQKAVQDGIKVPDEPQPKNGSPDNDSNLEQKRALDLLSALEFTRLYEAFLKKGDNAKNGKKMADARTGAVIARALKEDWGLRDVKQYVDKAIAQQDAPAPKNKGGRPAQPFKDTDQQLVIYKKRLGALTADQRQSLRKALEGLLQELAEKPVPSKVAGPASNGAERHVSSRAEGPARSRVEGRPSKRAARPPTSRAERPATRRVIRPSPSEVARRNSTALSNRSRVRKSS